MIPGIDVATTQRNLDFTLARRAGYAACYVKLGGDNVGRYVAPYYASQIDRARAAGFPHVGHYWVPDNAQDPAGAARYFTANARWQAGDFAVLDNESLDGATLYTDARAAVWVRTVADLLNLHPGRIFVYIGAADLRARTWPQLETLGVRLIVASYGRNAGARDHEPNLGGRFGGVWAGHQYTSNGNIGGITVDLNLFQDWAFTSTSPAAGTLTPIEEDDMPLSEDDLTRMSERIRNSEWFLGPNGEPLRFEQALKDIANRQVGYGRRIEDLQENLLPAALRAIADADANDAAPTLELTDAQVAQLGSAIASAGIVARLDDATLQALAVAAADERDRRERARLGTA